jgi:hypothetical protein
MFIFRFEECFFGERSVILKCTLVRMVVLFAICLLIFPPATASILQVRTSSSSIAELIITVEEHFIDVPFYYQVKNYYCGPAALQMVFDYYGENVSQFEIADVARTVPYVTYTDEMRRAAHFSNVSISRGTEMAVNITGYAARKLGYAAFEMWDMTLEQLKDLIDEDFPMILLMRWIPGEEYGHYRVPVGYNSTHVFLHDPWNNIQWGGDYGGPDLPMNYTFFSEMWDYSGHWGLFISPWSVKIQMPNTVYAGQNFTVTANIIYTCPSSIPQYEYEASSCNATVTLPEGLTLADDEAATKSFGNIYVGDVAQTFWKVTAEHPGNYSISVEVEGKIEGFVGEKPDAGPSYGYEDRIGGFATGFVDVEVASQIYIQDILPSEGVPETDVVVLGGGATPNGTVVALFEIVKEIVVNNTVFFVVDNETVGWTAADAHGYWSIPFTVPQVPTGEYNVFVLDNATLKSDVAKFNVLPVQPVQISLEYISPSEGSPGTVVLVGGHGASAYSEVRVIFNHLNVANTIATRDGGWESTFTVPAVDPGNYTITALDVASNTTDMATFNVLATPPSRSVGVKVGDWAKYNLTFDFSTNDPQPPITPFPVDNFEHEYVLLKVVSVTGTNVTYETTIRYRNGTEISSVSWLDVSSGQTYFGSSMSMGILIGANLTASEKVYLNPYALTINSTVTGIYAGLEREVNCLILSTNASGPPGYWIVGKTGIFWDKVSGILCEQSMEAWYTKIEEGYKTHMLLRIVIMETNIWTCPSGVSVNISFYPKTLNLRSKGKWIICRVELPEGFKVKDVDVSTLMLNDTVSGKACNKAKTSRYLIVKFDKKVVIDLIASLPKFRKLSFTVTGKFKDGTSFSGTTTIRFKSHPSKHHPFCARGMQCYLWSHTFSPCSKGPLLFGLTVLSTSSNTYPHIALDFPDTTANVFACHSQALLQPSRCNSFPINLGFNR